MCQMKLQSRCGVCTVCLQAMIYASRCIDSQESLNGAQYDEDSSVFFLELLIKVVLQNRSFDLTPVIHWTLVISNNILRYNGFGYNAVDVMDSRVRCQQAHEQCTVPPLSTQPSTQCGNLILLMHRTYNTQRPMAVCE